MAELTLADAWALSWSGSEQTSFSGPVESALENLWRDVLGEMPGGARVLELGSGPGQLSRLIARLAAQRGRKADILATDLVGLPPQKMRALADAGVRFESGVRIEALPYAQETFDLVVSQFGIEYAALELAAAEVARVLAPGGRAVFLCHHRASLIELGRITEAMTTLSLLARAFLVQVQREFGGPASTGEDAAARLASTLSDIRSKAGQLIQFPRIASLVRACEQAADAVTSSDPRLLQVIEDAARSIDAQLLVDDARQRHALDEAGIRRLAHLLEAAGLRVFETDDGAPGIRECRRMRKNDPVGFAWFLLARRPATGR